LCRRFFVGLVYVDRSVIGLDWLNRDRRTLGTLRECLLHGLPDGQLFECRQAMHSGHLRSDNGRRRWRRFDLGKIRVRPGGVGRWRGGSASKAIKLPQKLSFQTLRQRGNLASVVDARRKGRGHVMGTKRRHGVARKAGPSRILSEID
jgi:hypothetical protein